MCVSRLMRRCHEKYDGHILFFVVFELGMSRSHRTIGSERNHMCSNMFPVFIAAHESKWHLKLISSASSVPKRRDMAGSPLSTDNGIRRMEDEGVVLSNAAEVTKRSPRLPGLSICEGGSLRLVVIQAGKLLIIRGLEVCCELNVDGGVHRRDEFEVVAGGVDEFISAG